MRCSNAFIKLDRCEVVANVIPIDKGQLRRTVTALRCLFRDSLNTEITPLVSIPLCTSRHSAREWRNLGHKDVERDNHPWPLDSGTPCRNDGNTSICV